MPNVVELIAYTEVPVEDSVVGRFLQAYEQDCASRTWVDERAQVFGGVAGADFWRTRTGAWYPIRRP
jgi:hypothetical protein